MKLAIARSGIVLALASLLQACGGGDGGNQPASGPRVSASATTVSVAATPGNDSPIAMVTLTVTNPPAAGLFVEGSYSTLGIDRIEFVNSSDTQGILHIVFRLPGSLQNDTYTDSIQLRVCTEQPCVTEIAGSPINVTTSYVVSGNGTSTVTIDRSSIQIGANTDEAFSRTDGVFLTISPTPISGIYVQTSHTSNGIQDVTSQVLAAGASADVDITFWSAQSLGFGTYTDTITITVCYDSSCVRQVQGSPFTVSTMLSVGTAPEPGVTPLTVASRVALPHNIIDAEFSKALNKIVMVGSYPASALYVYDVATGAEQQQSLNKLPTAVSVSPDGLTAAVGHDALITVVDLATVGQPGAPAPILLNVSADVFDLVLDGRGSVHAFPRVDQWVQPHSIDIATNTEQLGSYPLRAGSHARLHPSADFIYTADNGLSPSDIQKWDITSGVATLLYDSPYHGDYGMCGDLWFNESGTTIYTPCGNTFRSNTVQAQDMIYSGALQLSPSGPTAPYGWRIRFLSQSAAQTEIALIEDELYQCEIVPSAGPCYEHLAFYESDFLNRLAVYALGPVTVNDLAYSQHGLFVFYDAVGTNKYLLSRLDGIPNPDAQYYLSVVP